MSDGMLGIIRRIADEARLKELKDGAEAAKDAGEARLREVAEKIEATSDARAKGLADQIAEMKEKFAKRRPPLDPVALAAVAAEKLKRGRPVSRPEAAAFLGVSTKKLQRMEAAGELRRCPGLKGVVRYEAREILRLASAMGKEV